MAHKRHQTPIDTCTTGFHFGTSGLWKQPAHRGMSKHVLSIMRTHQAHADGGMLEVKHSEVALGGSDNMGSSQSPKGYLLTMIPSSGSHVFLLTKAFPQAQVGPGWADLEQWLGQWQGFERRLKWLVVTYRCQHACVSCCCRLRLGWIWRDFNKTTVTL